jgi:hypothetical protein
VIWDIVLAATFAFASWRWARHAWLKGYTEGYSAGAVAMRNHIFEQTGYVSAEDQD